MTKKIRSVVTLGLVLAGCGPHLGVELDGRSFAVTSAAAVAYDYSTSYGMRSATVLVFGGAPDLCEAFASDVVNYCNARLAPDVHVAPWGYARPAQITAPLGWVVLRDARVGSADTVPLLREGSTFGVTLSEPAAPPVRSQRFSASIDRLDVGSSVGVSFEATLTGGRTMRGAVEATWCPALNLGTDNDNTERLSASARFTSAPNGHIATTAISAGCLGETLESECAVDEAANASGCECRKNGGPATTCSVLTADLLSYGATCCRFGE